MSWTEEAKGLLKQETLESMLRHSKLLQSMQYNLKYLKKERGAIFVLTALMLPVLLGCLGFAYDAGNLYIHKARLQNTADAAALAGGRAYVNALSEYATNGVLTSITEEQKEAAQGILKSSAQQYIRANNPLFAGKTGKDEQFWFGTKSTSTGENTTNSTEYFRVNLTEPVQLYFLPVIGIQNSVDVKVYATTKLTDSVESSGGSTNPNEAQYNPVMILGNNFRDRDNTNAGQNVTTYYDNGTVYVVNGANIERARVDADGDYAVPTHSGGDTTIYLDDGQNIIGQVNGRKVVETSYDIDAFGEEIKELFIKKQNYSATQLAPYYEDLNIWKNGKVAYLTAYNNWLKGTASYRAPATLEEAQTIHSLVKGYLEMYEPWNDSTTWAKVKEQWIADGYPLTDNENQLSYIIKDLNLKYDWDFSQGPNESSWTQKNPYQYLITNSKGVLLRNGDEAPVISSYTGGLTQEPKISDSKYGNLEYYMTYHGGQGKLSKTSIISMNTELSGNEHSYCYLSPAKYGYSHDPGISIEVDGFYVNPEEGITETTPFYLFIEEDARVENVIFTNLASADLKYRPLILCYLGNFEMHFNFNASDKTTVKNGIFYAPHVNGDTHVNFNGDTFGGSIITGSIDMENGQNLTYVDGKAAWGMDFTQNIGFNTSNSGHSGGSTNTITLTDRLRLFLAGNTNQNYYYNPDDGNWNWTAL